ncbi:MAG: hypothetical protein V2A71_06390 [Candidatus Eisenbacteria bacterium]
MKRNRLPYVLLFVLLGTVPFVWGCVAHFRADFPFVIRGSYYHHARPHPHYYCYDCHGYRYFDPYYDFCANYGFRMRWDRYPSLWTYYERHHVTIERERSYFSRYKYKPGYKSLPLYKRPTDYRKWEKSGGRTYYQGKESIKKEESGKSKESGKSTKSGKSKESSKSKESGKTSEVTGQKSGK